MDDRTKVQELLTGLKAGEATAIDLIELREAAGVEAGKHLVIRTIKEPPKRAESGPRAHVVNDAAGFVSYVQRYGGANTVVFVKDGGQAIHAVLDETAEKGVEVVTLKPAVHPRWKPWHDLIGRQIPLAAFVDHLRVNRKAVLSPDGREVLHLVSQIKASTSVTLHQGKGNGALNGILIQTKIAGQAAGKQDVVDLPDKVTVRSPIFVAGEEQDTELDLYFQGSPDGASVSVQVSSADLAEAEIEAFAEFAEAVEVLRDEPGAVVLHGEPDRAAWTYER